MSAGAGTPAPGRTVRVAAVQYRAVPGERERNLAALEGLVEAAAGQGAALVVLPEMCTTGIVLEAPAKAAALAEPLDGPTAGRLGRLARRAGVHLAAGLPTCGRGGALRNTQVLLGPSGARLGHYHKNHLYGPDFDWARRGRVFRAVPTPIGVVGLCVCFDVRFVHTWEALRAQGAELVALSANWVDDAPPWAYWSAPLRRYRMALVGANNWGEEAGIVFSGGSGVIDPAGTVVAATARQGDAVVVADVALPAATPAGSGARGSAPGPPGRRAG